MLVLNFVHDNGRDNRNKIVFTPVIFGGIWVGRAIVPDDVALRDYADPTRYLVLEEDALDAPAESPAPSPASEVMASVTPTDNAESSLPTPPATEPEATPAVSDPAAGASSLESDDRSGFTITLGDKPDAVATMSATAPAAPTEAPRKRGRPPKKATPTPDASSLTA